MAVRKKGYSQRPLRPSRRTRDEPPLGAWQSKVIKKLIDLEPEAFGYRVLEGLMHDFRDTKVWIDPAQVYTVFRKLLADDKKYIEQVDVTVASRGPPAKVFRVTDAGRAALQATIDYHRASADYLEGRKSKRVRSR